MWGRLIVGKVLFKLLFLFCCLTPVICFSSIANPTLFSIIKKWRSRYWLVVNQCSHQCSHHRNNEFKSIQITKIDGCPKKFKLIQLLLTPCQYNDTLSIFDFWPTTCLINWWQKYLCELLIPNFDPLARPWLGIFRSSNISRPPVLENWISYPNGLLKSMEQIEGP